MTCFKAASAEPGASGNEKEAESVLLPKHQELKRNKQTNTGLSENKENTKVRGRETLSGPWRGVISVARFPREAMLFEIWKVRLDNHFLDCQRPGCPVLGLWGSQGSPWLRVRTKASG